jgi:hypothetical protein
MFLLSSIKPRSKATKLPPYIAVVSGCCSASQWWIDPISSHDTTPSSSTLSIVSTEDIAFLDHPPLVPQAMITRCQVRISQNGTVVML